MERSHRPPPLTIPPPPHTRTRVRRARRPNHRQARQFKRWLLRAQIANDVAHVAAASILLWIMSWFLYNVPYPLTYRTGPAAVALIGMLSADILLDARSIIHAHDPWPGWALVVRLILGLGYIAIFAVYSAFGGDVFAPDFEYWGMSDAYGRVLAYMFLWGLGLWTLLFIVLCRHWLSKEMTRYSADVKRLLNARRRCLGPSGARHRLRSAGSVGGDGTERIADADVDVDIEAARPVREEETTVGLPMRMGVRRVKNSLGGANVSVDSITNSGTATTSTSPPPPPPPPEAVIRPA